MLSQLIFTERKDCLCHVNLSHNSEIASGSFLNVSSVSSNKNIYISCKSAANCQNNTIEINGIFGWHNKFKHNEEVIIHILTSSNIKYADSVNLVPLTNNEWELMSNNTVFIQDNFLHQVCAMQVNGVYPIWVGKTCMILRAECLNPTMQWCVVTANTTLNIIPVYETIPRSISPVSTDSSKTFTAKKSKELIAKKKPQWHYIVRTVKILFDFLHFLITGKTVKQKQLENDILATWFKDLSPNIENMLHTSIIGRGYRSSTVNHCNILLNRFTDPVIISAPEVYQRHVCKMLIGHFHKVPFNSRKSSEPNVTKDELHFACFVQFINGVDASDRVIKFIFPDALWSEIGLHVGDLFVCSFNQYDYVAVKEIRLEVPNINDRQLVKEIMDSFVENVNQVNDDFTPLLVRENMKVTVNIKDKSIEVKIKFTTSDRSNQISHQYCLISRYFISDGMIPISIIDNISMTIGSDILYSNDERSNLKESITNDSLASLLISRMDSKRNQSFNIMICGPSGIGKSFFCNNICRFLLHDEDYQYFSINIDCRDMIGMQTDSVRQKLSNILLECCWRSPSIVCLDNLDCLVPNIVSDDANPSQSTQISLMAFTFKYFFESILRINSLCKVITIATCSDVYKLHEAIIGIPSQKSVVFEDIIDMTEYNKDIFISAVDGYCKQWTKMGFFDDEKRNATFDWLKCESKYVDNLYGFDAVTLMKHVWTNVSKRYGDGLCKNIRVEKSDFHEAFDRIVSAKHLKNVHTKLHFTDLYGLTDVKKLLTEIFVWPSSYPKLFQKSPIKLQQGLLLYGLPGCGKSYIAMALSNEVKMNFIMIKGPELLSKYIGASEEQVRQLFNEARRTQPTLIFFDEFDSLAPRRGHDSTGVTDRVVNQLLTEIDGVSGLNNAGVFIIAASNRPDLIDPAVLRPGRISGRAHCQLPSDISERVCALEFLLRKSGISVSDESVTIWEYLIEKRMDPQWLQWYSYADLVAVVNVTENTAVIRFDGLENNSKCMMNLSDFTQAVQKSRPSLARGQIKEYLNAFEIFDKTGALQFNSKVKATLA